MAGLVGRTLDHYRLEEQIGQGGMATVYRAYDTRREEDVAIKVLSPTITGERRFVKRFRREAEIVKQRLKHPNIVPVIAYGETDGYVYIVMPFIKGETLSERLVRKGLTEREANEYLGQICDALHFAHKKRIIHRDIKPANIMLKDSGEAVLMDFGLARHMEGSGRLTGSMLMGTPAFVSPEQAQGKKLDARSDQYSLGIVLYLIATGHLPFDTESPMALVLMHIQDPVPRPSRLNPSLKPALERVILKTLAKSKDERFNDIAELKRAYQAALGGDPVPWVEAPTEVIPGRAVEIGGDLPRKLPFPTWVIPASAVPIVAMLAILVFRSSAADQGDRGNGLVPVEGFSLTATLPVTPTEAPPTATPEPTAIPTPVEAADCPGLRMIGFSRQGNQVSWSIENSSGSQARITTIGFTWRGDNVPQEVGLGGGVWLDEGEIAGLIDATNAQISDDPRATIPDDTIRSFNIKHLFGPLDDGRYALELLFEVGTGRCLLQTEY
ncbi:MAG: serine/threonine protein kinase [Chloroflexi bacterium]|nr:serine/threonine protein kinase [Chloroflexota bacterium]